MSTTHAYRSNIILAAVDFSDSSTAVVEQAMAVAQRRRPVELHFLHVDQSRKDDEEGREYRRFELLEWLGARLPQEETRSMASPSPHTKQLATRGVPSCRWRAI